MEIGTEGYVFESGPFTSFGKQVLQGTVTCVLHSCDEQVLEAVLAGEESCPGRDQRLTWTPECNLTPKYLTQSSPDLSCTYCSPAQVGRALPEGAAEHLPGRAAGQ